MTDKYELSRRKALAALGTIGAAGAGVGMGTSAYFSDQETFTNNQLVAGELDLHVGWEEHYSDWSDDESEGIDNIEMVDRGETAAANRTGLPLDADTPENGTLITVENVSQAQRLLNNTEVGNYSNATGSFDAETFDPANACDYLQPGSEQSPVIIDLDDVKPGDFGEVTFSLASCTNPAFLWMNGGLVEARENGQTEPEAEDPDETGGPNDSITSLSDAAAPDIELLDAVQTALWYDNGDNLQLGGAAGTTDIDVVLTLDNSNSVSNSGQVAIADAAETLVDLLSASSQSAAVSFSVGSTLLQGLTTNKQDVKKALDTYDDPQTSGQTEIGEGIETAQTELDHNGNPGADDVIVVLSDGEPFPSGAGSNTLQQADAAKSAGTRILSVGFEIGTGGEEYLRAIAGTTPNSQSEYNNNGTADEDAEGDYLAAPTQSDLEQAFRDVAGRITSGEELIIRDSLRNVIDALCNSQAGDYGLPLDGDRSTQFDETGGSVDSTDRDAFAAGTRHDFGFAWWVPRSVGNQIQSDSATFSLSFYAVQSRNNSGFGNA